MTKTPDDDFGWLLVSLDANDSSVNDDYFRRKISSLIPPQITKMMLIRNTTMTQVVHGVVVIGARTGCVLEGLVDTILVMDAVIELNLSAASDPAALHPSLQSIDLPLNAPSVPSHASSLDLMAAVVSPHLSTSFDRLVRSAAVKIQEAFHASLAQAGPGNPVMEVFVRQTDNFVVNGAVGAPQVVT